MVADADNEWVRRSRQRDACTARPSGVTGSSQERHASGKPASQADVVVRGSPQYLVDATPTPAAVAGPVAFLGDLAPESGGTRLLEVVEDAAARSRNATPAAHDPGDDRMRLLVLLAYCYLGGTYRTQEVVLRVESDPALTSWFPEVGFRAEELRSFRRAHRGLLTACMARALAEVRPTPAECVRGATLFSRATNLGRLDCIEEARARLENAVLLDALALDV